MLSRRIKCAAEAEYSGYAAGEGLANQTHYRIAAPVLRAEEPAFAQANVEDVEGLVRRVARLDGEGAIGGAEIAAF